MADSGVEEVSRMMDVAGGSRMDDEKHLRECETGTKESHLQLCISHISQVAQRHLPFLQMCLKNSFAVAWWTYRISEDS